MFSFTNSTGITILDNETVSQTVTVPLGVTITGLTLTLNGLTHTFPADLDFLLVAPDGTSNLLFWSDAGGVAPLTNANFTISDAATTLLPDGAGLVSGTAYRPMDSGGADGLEGDAEFGTATGGVDRPQPSGTATLASA